MTNGLIAAAVKIFFEDSICQNKRIASLEDLKKARPKQFKGHHTREEANGSIMVIFSDKSMLYIDTPQGPCMTLILPDQSSAIVP